MWGGVTYERITDDGLVIARDGVEELLAVETVVLCAGQEPERSLAEIRRRGLSAPVVPCDVMTSVRVPAVSVSTDPVSAPPEFPWLSDTVACSQGIRQAQAPHRRWLRNLRHGRRTVSTLDRRDERGIDRHGIAAF